MLELILIPIISSLITQAIKLIIDGIPNNFTWQHILRDYGGMPSGHTAFVSSLLMIVGLTQGFNSAAFAIAFALMVVVIRDAVGFRREIGRNAVLTNLLAKEIFSGKKNSKINYLYENMGHSFAEVMVGFLIGSGLAILFYLIFLP